MTLRLKVSNNSERKLLLRIYEEDDSNVIECTSVCLNFNSEFAQQDERVYFNNIFKRFTDYCTKTYMMKRSVSTMDIHEYFKASSLIASYNKTCNKQRDEFNDTKA